MFKMPEGQPQYPHNRINPPRIFFSLATGLLLTGAFPRTGMSFIAWFAWVPLMMAARNLSLKDGFILGFLGGLAHYVTLIYWLYHTMGTYGGLPFYVSIPVLFLLSAYLSLYPGLFIVTVLKTSPTPLRAAITMPVVWTGLEYLRTFVFTGFPWGLMGYSQFKLTTLIQIADITGVYGVSFLLLAVNAGLLLLVLALVGGDWRGHAISRKSAAVALAAALVLTAAAWGYGAWRVQKIARLAENARKVSVAVAQGNIDQAVKWNPAFQIATVKKYIELTQAAAAAGSPDLMVWPETAMPFYYADAPRLTKMVENGIKKMPFDILIGSPSFVQEKDRTAYYNSAFLVSPDGKTEGKYDKAHLVPFGEYVPLRKWFPFIGKMVAAVGDFAAGEKGKVLSWNKTGLGVQICYEIIFPGLSRALVKNGAGLIVNMTNDAWYGRTSAPFQFFSMTVFRAIENRRSLVRSANTGISGFIAPTGEIMKRSGIFTETHMRDEMPILELKTFYTRMGDVFVFICLIIAGIVLILSRKRVKR